jgi:hypothetical protein
MKSKWMEKWFAGFCALTLLLAPAGTAWASSETGEFVTEYAEEYVQEEYVQDEYVEETGEEYGDAYEDEYVEETVEEYVEEYQEDYVETDQEEYYEEETGEYEEVVEEFTGNQ